MVMIKKLTTTWALLLLVMAAQAQDFDKQQVVNRLAEIMNSNYVFPEKGREMNELIKRKIKSGAYDAITSPNAFASALERDLRFVQNDRHIRVRYSPERVAAMQAPRQPEEEGGEPKNYGFEEVLVLEGNIGYLDLRGFAGIGRAEETARKAMDVLIQTDAIIFDLRQNGGGSPSMIRFISSYLFGDEPVHLNTFYWRPDDRYEESWTMPNEVSAHKPNIPVFVLTSDYTFSAAEEFTYNLKNLKRATIIGETTGGGAHPGGPMVINQGFIVNVPQGRAINPITKTNWEGVGIEPNVKVSSEKALEVAYDMAKTHLGLK
jgi:C-terminal processing protease CtpA/Prc